MRMFVVSYCQCGCRCNYYPFKLKSCSDWSLKGKCRSHVANVRYFHNLSRKRARHRIFTVHIDLQKMNRLFTALKFFTNFKSGNENTTAFQKIKPKNNAKKDTTKWPSLDIKQKHTHKKQKKTKLFQLQCKKDTIKWANLDRKQKHTYKKQKKNKVAPITKSQIH